MIQLLLLFLIVVLFVVFCVPRTKQEPITEFLILPPNTYQIVTITNSKNSNQIHLCGVDPNHLYMYMTKTVNKKVVYSTYYIDFPLHLNSKKYLFGIVTTTNSYFYQNNNTIVRTTQNFPQFPFETFQFLPQFSYTVNNALLFDNNMMIGFDNINQTKCIITSSVLPVGCLSIPFLKKSSNKNVNYIDFTSTATVTSTASFQSVKDKIQYKNPTTNDNPPLLPRTTSKSHERITFVNNMYIDGSSSASPFLSFVGNNVVIQVNSTRNTTALFTIWNFQTLDPMYYGTYSTIDYNLKFNKSKMLPNGSFFPLTKPLLYSIPKPIGIDENKLSFQNVDQILLYSDDSSNAILLQVTSPSFLYGGVSVLGTTNKSISIQSILYNNGSILRNPSATQILYLNLNVGTPSNMTDIFSEEKHVYLSYDSDTPTTNPLSQPAPFLSDVETLNSPPNQLLCKNGILFEDKTYMSLTEHGNLTFGMVDKTEFYEFHFVNNTCRKSFTLSKNEIKYSPNFSTMYQTPVYTISFSNAVTCSSLVFKGYCSTFQYNSSGTINLINHFTKETIRFSDRCL